MRATVLLISILLCHSYAHAYEFIFKNGKTLRGSILYEDSSLYRVVDSTGVELRIRKIELNLAAMESRNISPDAGETSSLQAAISSEPVPAPAKRNVRVYTNRDVPAFDRVIFTPPNPASESAWLKSISKLERDFTRLQGACRGAGTGPNLSKVLRTHTYNVQGRPVSITAYWADPANIEDAKKICNRAIQTELSLREARKQFAEFQQDQQRSTFAR